ncbi:MAG: flippase-like domain-containing protein [Deltaproteobacteria bacterium]|nr:flippase-like domain-containing protein [Deltaproteobacteria bacterium]
MTKKILKNLLPWLVAAGLLYYLFRQVSPKQVLESLRYLNIPLFIGFGVVYFVTIMVLDTWVLSRVLSRFAAPVSFRELLPVRCVSYLLSLVNYNAGQASLAVFLKRTRDMSFFKTLGCIFFVTVIDLYWVIALAFAGSFLMDLNMKGFQLEDWVRRVAFIALAGLILHLAFWRGWFGKILPKRFHFRLGDWLRGKHLFQPFHHATLADYGKIALSRLPIHATIISSMWFLIRIAGASVPYRNILGAIPIVLLTGAIPLTPGGLGAAQIAIVQLLKNYVTPPAAAHGTVAPEELLLAISLTWMILNYLFKSLAGLISLRWTSRDLFKEPTDAAMH